MQYPPVIDLVIISGMLLNSRMQAVENVKAPNPSKAFKRAVLAFCIFGGGLAMIKLCPYYLATDGMSDWKDVYYRAALSGTRGGLAAAVLVYLATKRDERKLNNAPK